MFRIARFLFPKPPRHASPIGTGRTRKADAPAKTAKSTASRPRPNYNDASGLPHVPTGDDGHTALFHQIGNPPAPEGPLGSNDATVSFDTVADVVDESNWYPDLYTHRPPPSLIGEPHSPQDATPCKGHAVQRQWMAAGDSATQPPAPITADWFRAERDPAVKNDNTLRAFHRRAELGLKNGTVPAPRREVGHVLDTTVFATVAQPVFDTTLVTPIGANR